jgi:glycosyltransferase involved in cell wall biosynthesis
MCPSEGGNSSTKLTGDHCSLVTQVATVSAIMAAYDEADAVASVVRACQRVLPAGSEVIVVDDGSRDATALQARGAGARVLRLDRNAGKGAALLHGANAARGDVLVFLDADGQDDPEDIAALLDALRPGVDLVIGSRFLGTLQPGAITPLHRIGNRVLTAVVNVLFGTRLTDTQAGFRCMSRQTLARCRPRARRYDIEVDLLLEVLRLGGRVIEVPVHRLPRGAGRSKLATVRDGGRILARILRHRLTH